MSENSSEIRNTTISEDSNSSIGSSDNETKTVRIRTVESDESVDEEKDIFADDDNKLNQFQTLGGMAQDSRIMKGERLARNINVSLGSMAITGTFAQILRMELCWDDTYLILLRGDDCSSGLYLGFFTIATTITTICLLFAFYYYQSIIEKARWGYSSNWNAFSKTKLWWKLTIEIFSLLVQPYPKLIPTTFKYPEVLVLWMTFFRFFYFFRAVRDYSALYQNRGQLQKEKQEGQKTVFHAVTSLTTFKIYFLRYSATVIAFSYLFLWVFFSYLLYIFERGFYLPIGDNNADGYTAAFDLVGDNKIVPDTNLWEKTPFNDLWVCLWMTAITMLTVGYGDYTAQTGVGKFIAMVSCIVGIILTSLVASAVTAAISESTPFERTLAQHLRDFELRNVAAQLIQINWKKKNLQMNATESRQFDRKRENVKKKFKTLRIIPPEPEDMGENRKSNKEEVEKVNALLKEIGGMIVSSGSVTKKEKRSFRKSFKATHRRPGSRAALSFGGL